MSLINKSSVRELALEIARRRFQTIPGYKMERVAGEFFDRMEASLRTVVVKEANKTIDALVEQLDGIFHSMVQQAVRELPAKGQTIR